MKENLETIEEKSTNNILNESILDSIKKLLNISKDDTAFDTDVIININIFILIYKLYKLHVIVQFFFRPGIVSFLIFSLIARIILLYIFFSVPVLYRMNLFFQFSHI